MAVQTFPNAAIREAARRPMEGAGRTWWLIAAGLGAVVVWGAIAYAYQLIGGLGVMVPERRAEVVALGMKSIIAGTLATCMTAAVAGLFI